MPAPTPGAGDRFAAPRRDGRTGRPRPGRRARAGRRVLRRCWRSASIVLARLGQGVGGVALIHQLEMRRERGLQREAAQQRLAEGVDGADAHAAGQVQHLGEQGAGALAQRRAVGSIASSRQVRGPARASSSVTHSPRVRCSRTAISAAAALVKVRHWMRSGLSPGEHQPQQPVGQQLGLARAGRGGDERRHRRVGGRQLLRGWRGRGGHRPLPLRGRGVHVFPRRGPFGDACQLGVVGEARRTSRVRLRQIAAARARRYASISAPSALPRRRDGRRDRRGVALEQRADLAGLVAAGQVPVDQLARLPLPDRRRTRRPRAIAASSRSCGARPASTSFWVGGVPVL